MSTDSTPRYFDPFSPEQRADPYPAFAQFRASAPFHWSPPLKAWVATCHQDVRTLLRDPTCQPADTRVGFVEMIARLGSAMPDARMVLDAVLLFERPPGHQLARRYLGRVLNARPLAESIPAIERIAAELFSAARRAGRVEFAREIAAPLPFRFMAELLGLPVQDVPYLMECCQGALLVFSSERSTSDDFFRIDHGASLALDYLEAEIVVRRLQPRDDGLSRMIQFGADETKISDREVAARCFFLFMVAVDTTASFLPIALHNLLRTPGEFTRWRQREVESGAAVEELLRHSGPAQFTIRIPAEARVFRGVTVEPGQRIAAVIASANRDETVFDNGDTLDLRRRPGPHLAFGDGAHLCLGAALARVMTAAVFEQVLALPSVSLGESKLEWVGCEMIRKLKSLTLELDARV